MVKVIYDKKLKFKEPLKKGAIKTDENIFNHITINNYSTKKGEGEISLKLTLPTYNSRTKTYEIQNIILERKFQ